MRKSGLNENDTLIKCFVLHQRNDTLLDSKSNQDPLMRNRMMKAAVFFFIICLIFFACVQKRDALQETKRKKVTLSITSDTCHIEIDSLSTFYYPKYSANDSLYIGYNPQRYTIDVFDYKNRKPVQKIELFREGPDAIDGRVEALFMQSLDSIFILSSTQLLILNQQGKVIYEMPMNGANQKEEIFSDFYSYGGNGANNLIYDAKKKTVYTSAMDIKFGQCSEKHYGMAMFKIDLLKQSVEITPFSYPQKYSSHYFGFFHDFEITWAGDKIIAVFPIESSLYLIDLDDYSVQITGGESELSNNHADPLEFSNCNDDDRKMKHYIENIQFRKIIYDPYRHLYYRFHYGEAKEPNPDGSFKTINEKEQILMVFSEEFEVIHELKLTDKRYPLTNAFVGPKGLYLSAPMNENSLRFKILKVEQI